MTRVGRTALGVVATTLAVAVAAMLASSSATSDPWRSSHHGPTTTRGRRTSPAAEELVRDDLPAPMPTGSPTILTVPSVETLSSRWTAGEERVEETAEIRERATRMLDDLDLRPSRIELSCTRSVCRSRLTFDSYDSLHELVDVPHDATSMEVGPPEFDESGLAVVVYWDRDRTDVPF